MNMNRWSAKRMTLVRISLARSAQCRVFWVSPNERLLGLIFAIIAVLQAPPNESLRSWVSFEFRYGICFLPSTRALMQLLSARSDLFILAPSSDLSVLWSVARALSEPARSMSDSFPTLWTTFMEASLTRYSTTTWKEHSQTLKQQKYKEKRTMCVFVHAWAIYTYVNKQMLPAV